MRLFIAFFLFFHLSLLQADSSAGSEEQLQHFIHFNREGNNRIGYLYIGDHEDSINQSTWLYIKQALDYYKQTRPIFIILELDTPGGEVFAAQKISDALKEIDIQYNIPVIAFINNWAISAGAMLAYSSRFIVAVKDASMGAAEPVLAGESGKIESASEKVNSAIRADFANRARFFDRNPLIAEAMVDKSLILVEREGKIVKLDVDSQLRTAEPNADIIISAKDKLLTLNAEELLKYKVANFVVEPEKLVPITPEEKEKGTWPLSKTLLTQIPFFASIPQAMIDQYQMDWKTRFFVFLATPLISSLLFMGLLVGAYMEMSTPGFGVAGSIAASCLFLIILSYFSLEIANWLELIILFAGLLLILVELFVLPSFGIVGVLGILLFLAGLFGILLPELRSVDFEYDTDTFNAAGEYVLKRLVWFSSTLVLSALVIALLGRFVAPTFTGMSRLVLVGHEQDASRGYIAGLDSRTLPQPGAKGEVLATLRPAGKIVVADQVYDAMSTGDFIEAGDPITIVRLEGSVLIVNRSADRKHMT